MEKIPNNLDSSQQQEPVVINLEEYKHSEDSEHFELFDFSHKEGESKAREAIFKSFIESRLYQVFEDSLNENGYTPEEIDEIRERLSEFGIDEKKRMLALAYENRNRILGSFKKRVEMKQAPVGELIDNLKKLADMFGSEVAYHCSAENIVPKTEKKFTGQSVEMVDSWEIVGTEKDHRFNDMKMAYFSFDYEHLYRVKNPKYLYLVRVKTQKDSGYHTDIGNNWGTAQNLDIIDKIEIASIDKFMDDVVAEYKKIGTKKDAA